MVVFEILLTAIAWIFFITGCYIILSCFIGTLRFKDFFVKVHAVKISNIYGVSFILFAQALNSADIIIFTQLVLIIILNILMTITTIHAICRIALNNNITHGGFSRRKYNEMLEEKRKKEEEEKLAILQKETTN
ncbi:MAG: monovalent cation/H(+) antiporter subunit G [Rickettsiales bacterium]|nr:monovalent cation/H(+) antiporter subunit G [Rickettsiales bacterium]